MNDVGNNTRLAYKRNCAHFMKQEINTREIFLTKEIKIILFKFRTKQQVAKQMIQDVLIIYRRSLWNRNRLAYCRHNFKTLSVVIKRLWHLLVAWSWINKTIKEYVKGNLPTGTEGDDLKGISASVWRAWVRSQSNTGDLLHVRRKWIRKINVRVDIALWTQTCIYIIFVLRCEMRFIRSQNIKKLAVIKVNIHIYTLSARITET
jgi:hypothetical protein